MNRKQAGPVIMKILNYLINLGDNKKQRNYVSEADQLMWDFNREHPSLSDSQKHEINKHKDIFNRKKKRNLFD